MFYPYVHALDELYVVCSTLTYMLWSSYMWYVLSLCNALEESCILQFASSHHCDVIRNLTQKLVIHGFHTA